jgi:uncharacterized membrane protein
MRGKIIALAIVFMSGTALPAMAQQESCLNEIQRLETAFAQESEGGGAQGGGGPGGGETPNADRAQSPATNREAISKDLERSGGVVAPPPIGSGIRTEQRGVEPVPMSKNPGQQPGGLAGAKLSPQQQDDMRAMLRDGRAAAERGDSQGCMEKVRQARQLARGATTKVPGSGGAGAGGG